MGRSGGKDKRMSSSVRSGTRSQLKKPLFNRNSADIIDDPVEALADRFHTLWSGQRRTIIEITEDPRWIKANGTDQVVLTETAYKDLPEDKKGEARAKALAAYEDYLKNPTEYYDDPSAAPFHGAHDLFKEQVDKIEEMLEEDIAQKERVSGEIASQLHDDWREGRKQADGTYEERVKTTTDQDWIEANGTDQVDIANTSYEDLPSDWQAENKAAAEAAYDAVNSSFNIEEASAKIHDEWLKRNGKWAEEHQKVPYAELSEEEKEKDREQARAVVAATPGLSLIDLGYGENRGNTIQNSRENASLADQIIATSQVDIESAKASIDFAKKFTKESEAIAKYAEAEAKKSGKSKKSIIEDIHQDPKKYTDKIPEVKENRGIHSGGSWGMVAGGALDLATDKDGSGRKRIDDYLARTERELKNKEIAAELKKRAIPVASERIKKKAREEVSMAEFGADSSKRFVSEAKAIASYAKKKAGNDTDAQERLISDIKENSTKYEKDIPEIAKNKSIHSGASWGMVTGQALTLAAPGGEKEKEEAAERYVQKESDELVAAKAKLDLRERSL